MARKPKIDLSKAQTTDGALPARSIYEAVGIPTTSYRHASLASYSKMINALDLIELQDHAYEQGVLAGPDRHTLIDRLERKYIQEHAKFAPTFEQPENEVNEDSREEAERILGRGR